MKLYWLMGLLALAAIILALMIFGPLRGTTNSDFPDAWQPDDTNTIPPCPSSPNCVRLSIPVQTPADEFILEARQALERMNAESIQRDPESLSIEAIFKIPIFGFRDNFDIRISNSGPDGGSIIHIASRSNEGYSDLGVNRRRVLGFLQELSITNPNL
ncbi:MAG: DUF1499 domain-containing protein [Balneolaceae bacterium]